MGRPGERKLRRNLAVMGVLAGARMAVADPGAYTIQQIGIPAGTNGGGPFLIDAAGQIAGFSLGGTASNPFPYTEWYYSPATKTTTLIGITDALHTNSGGTSSNVGQYMNASGVVAGEAEQFFSKGNGYDAWVYSPATNTTTIVGLLDANHSTSSERFERVFGINSSGEVLGSASSYGSSGATGADVWIYSPSTNSSQIIGLTDALHTESTYLNTRQDFAGGINDAGDAIGYAVSYLSNGGQGLDAWYYSPVASSSQIIGITDAAHTASNGTSTNRALLLSANGLAAGFSNRYNGGTSEGQDAWVYSPVSNTTTIIGLTDAAHTQTGGYIFNQPVAISNSGQIAGTANRYSGSTAEGQDAWVYSPATQSTQQIGLVDAGHMQTSGYATTTLTAQNNSGLLAGHTERFSGNSDEGYDAWIFDPSSNTTYDLFASQSTTGQAMSQVSYLSGDGTAVGFYENYSGGSTGVEDAFRWSESGGFQDLGALVQGGLSTNGWASLAYADLENSSGLIAGVGTTSSGAFQPFLLTPAASVPEPAMGLVVSAPLLLTLSRRRRKS